MSYFDQKTVNTALVTTLGAAASINRSQDLDEITDSIPEMDLPLIQVYPQTWSGASGSQSHLNTFAGKGGVEAQPIKVRTWSYNCDIYVARKARFNENITKMVEVATEIEELLDAENISPLFGEEAIRAFQYEAEFAIFEYSQAQYVGYRLVLTLTLF